MSCPTLLHPCVLTLGQLENGLAVRIFGQFSVRLRPDLEALRKTRGAHKALGGFQPPVNKGVTSACLVSLLWFHQQGVAKSLHFCCLDAHSQELMGLERFSGIKQHLDVVSINCCSADGDVRNASIIVLDRVFCEAILFMGKTWGTVVPSCPWDGYADSVVPFLLFL